MRIEIFEKEQSTQTNDSRKCHEPFLPAGFGTDVSFSFRTYIRTKEDVIKTSEDIRSLCRKEKLDPKKTYYLALCVEELGMNAVHHGFEKAGQSAEVRVTLVNDVLTLHFRDNARQFDLTKWMEMFDPKDPSAHIGIKILTGISREVTYMNSLNTNNVLIKL